MHALNTVLNRIHEWCEPEQNPMTRMFASRAAGIVCVPVEIAAIVRVSLTALRQGCSSTLDITRKSFRWLFYRNVGPKSTAPIDPKDTLGNSLLTIGKLVVGVICTLFFGIFFSPELNFRIHTKLGIASDNITLRKQKELAIKLDLEQKKAEIEKARQESYAKFQADMQAHKEAKEQAKAIYAHLAEMLYPPVASGFQQCH